MIPAMKRVIAHGMDDREWLTVRPPIEQLKQDDSAALIEALSTAGFEFAHLRHRLVD